MLNDSGYLEKVWGEILSQRPARIKRMFTSLDTSSQQEVIRHLRRMASEDGWQESQIISAKAALQALEPTDSSKNE
jgi:hypothetical protein